MNKNSTIEYMESIIEHHNAESSKGYVILKDDIPVKIRTYFDYFLDTWIRFNDTLLTEDIKKVREFLSTNTMGGLITNGDVIINLTQIAYMVKR